jgi:putative hydrolase of the HAD superfamily
MKFFLTDIGNVLTDFDDRDLLAAVIRSTSHDPQQATARAPVLDDLVEKGMISDAEYLLRLNEIKGLAWSIDDLTEVWSQVFSLNEAGWKLYEGAAQAGVPAYMLSNIAQFHINAIKRNWPGFFDSAKGLFLSYQIGVRKPHPDIYRHVLDQLGAEGDECFFIDDLPGNVEAARAAGMHAHLFMPENFGAIREAADAFFGW